MLIEPPRSTDDGVTIAITPDGAAPTPVVVRVPPGLGIDASADAAVPAALLVAMRRGEPLRCTHGLSPRLLRSTDRFQRVLGAWDRHLHGRATRFTRIPVEAPRRPDTATDDDDRGTACFFTAGADSFHSAITNRERLDALIHVRGFGTPPPDTPLGEMVGARVREAARMLGLPLIEISTDLKALADANDVSWDEYHGSALAAVALLLAPHFSQVLIPATNPYTDLVPLGSHPLLDPLWSTERVEIVHDGADADRIDKLRTTAGHPAGRAHLQVCWQHLDGGYNCGRCEKCIRTGVAVRLAGLDGAFPGLPTPRARRVVRTRLVGRGQAWRHLDEVARSSDQRALSWAIRVARARHRIARARRSPRSR